MNTGRKLKTFGIALTASAALLCSGTMQAASETTHAQHKSKKQQPLPPPLPSGPTGRPVQQIPLDNIATVPPQVTFQNNQLTIVAPNSTLADVLRAVRKQTGAEIEVPSAPEHIVTHLGPGPAREVIAELLNGSRFNYVILGSPTDDLMLTRVVLVARSSQDTGIAPMPQQPDVPQGVAQNNIPQPPQDAAPEDASDDNADDNADQTPEAEQQQQDQQQKTPQQMMQEMQQRQMQLQQQQPPNQPPIPGPGRPFPQPPQQ